MIRVVNILGDDIICRFFDFHGKFHLYFLEKMATLTYFSTDCKS